MADKAPAQSFLQKHKLPIFLAILAVALYGGSILYIVFGKGQIA